MNRFLLERLQRHARFPLSGAEAKQFLRTIPALSQPRFYPGLTEAQYTAALGRNTMPALLRQPPEADTVLPNQVESQEQFEVSDTNPETILNNEIYFQEDQTQLTLEIQKALGLVPEETQTNPSKPEIVAKNMPLEGQQRASRIAQQIPELKREQQFVPEPQPVLQNSRLQPQIPVVAITKPLEQENRASNQSVSNVVPSDIETNIQSVAEVLPTQNKNIELAAMATSLEAVEPPLELSVSEVATILPEFIQVVAPFERRAAMQELRELGEKVSVTVSNAALRQQLQTARAARQEPTRPASENSARESENSAREMVQSASTMTSEETQDVNGVVIKPTVAEAKPDVNTQTPFSQTNDLANTVQNTGLESEISTPNNLTVIPSESVKQNAIRRRVGGKSDSSQPVPAMETRVENSSQTLQQNTENASAVVLQRSADIQESVELQGEKPFDLPTQAIPVSAPASEMLLADGQATVQTQSVIADVTQDIARITPEPLVSDPIEAAEVNTQFMVVSDEVYNPPNRFIPPPKAKAVAPAQNAAEKLFADLPDSQPQDWLTLLQNAGIQAATETQSFVVPNVISTPPLAKTKSLEPEINPNAPKPAKLEPNQPVQPIPEQLIPPNAQVKPFESEPIQLEQTQSEQLSSISTEQTDETAIVSEKSEITLEPALIQTAVQSNPASLIIDQNSSQITREEVYNPPNRRIAPPKPKIEPTQNAAEKLFADLPDSQPQDWLKMLQSNQFVAADTKPQVESLVAPALNNASQANNASATVQAANSLVPTIQSARDNSQTRVTESSIPAQKTELIAPAQKVDHVIQAQKIESTVQTRGIEPTLQLQGVEQNLQTRDADLGVEKPDVQAIEPLTDVALTAQVVPPVQREVKAGIIGEEVYNPPNRLVAPPKAKVVASTQNAAEKLFASSPDTTPADWQAMLRSIQVLPELPTEQATVASEPTKPLDGNQAGVLPNMVQANNRQSLLPNLQAQPTNQVLLPQNQIQRANQLIPNTNPLEPQNQPLIAPRVQDSSGRVLLSEDARQFLKPITGIDPATVDIRQDATSNAITKAHQADALAVGNQILLSSQLQPNTPETLGVLAHELTHVARQRQSRFIAPMSAGKLDNSSLQAEEGIALQIENQTRLQAKQSFRNPTISPNQPNTNLNASVNTNSADENMVNWNGTALPAALAATLLPAATRVAPVAASVSNFNPPSSDAMSYSAPVAMSTNAPMVAQAAETNRAAAAPTESASAQTNPKVLEKNLTSQPAPDLDKLAEQVYAILKRRIRTETQRLS